MTSTPIRHAGQPIGAASDTKHRLVPRFALLALPACTALNGLSASSITAALPALDAELDTTGWVLPGFFAGAAIAAVASGRLADLLGARRVAAAGVLLVVLSSLAATLATSGPGLAAARTVLGMGTAALFPAALVILRQLGLPAPRQLAALGTLALATEAAFAAGPALGALLVDLGGWRLAVAAPIPPALLAAILLRTAVPADPAAPRRLRIVAGRLDLPGLALLAVAACSALLWLQAPNRTWLPLAAAVVLLGAFAVWERRSRHPVLPAAVLTRPLTVVFGRVVLYYGGLYGLVLALPAWLTTTRQLAPGAAAAVMAGLPVTAILACLLTPPLIARHGPRLALVLGSVALGSAAGICVLADSRTPTAVLVLAVCLAGFPAGLVNIAQQETLVRAAPQKFTGTCSGIYGLLQLLTGAAVGGLPIRLHSLGWIALAMAIGLVLLAAADAHPTATTPALGSSTRTDGDRG